MTRCSYLWKVCHTGGQLMTWCDHCELYQPARSSHCHFCDVCVRGRDHHCVWYVCLHVSHHIRTHQINVHFPGTARSACCPVVILLYFSMTKKLRDKWHVFCGLDTVICTERNWSVPFMKLISFQHNVVLLFRSTLASFLWPLCIADADIIFLPCSFFLSTILFPRLFSAVADWMSTVLPHVVWP